MEKFFVFACIISILFCILKFIELKYIEKKFPPLKYLIRDMILVFFSSFIGLYAFSQLNGQLSDFFHVITGAPELVGGATPAQIFTGEPEF